MKSNLITRFAPSPTGGMHLGNARTAILNWLIATKSQGKMRLRIEDTDQERSTKEAELWILDTLDWLGIKFEAPIVRQSERLELYQKRAQELLQNGSAYYCFCSEEKLSSERKIATDNNEPPRYNGTCKKLTAEEIKAKLDSNAPYTIRFKLPKNATNIEFTDQIKGQMNIPPSAFGDFVILRTNKWPSYNFAVVCDDIEMNINFVLRGEDHLTNTARQILIYNEFQAKVPTFAHHGLLLGADGRKLSKRNGAKTILELKETGILPLAFIHYLTSLAGSIPNNKLYKNIQELSADFVETRLGKDNVVFTEHDLISLNRKYLCALSPEQLFELTNPHINCSNWKNLNPNQQKNLLVLFQDCIVENTKELEIWITRFTSPNLILDEDAKIVLDLPETKKLLSTIIEEILPEFENIEKLTSQNIKQLFDLAKTKTGFSGKNLFHPVRYALLGTAHGPELNRLMQIFTISEIKNKFQQAFLYKG